MSDFLKREGYALVEAEDGQQALDLFISEKGIGLVILDVMMPRLDGWIVCREIRKASNVPVIMLTARSEESDQLFGLDIGADEYITKPFSPMILVARVKALLRRAGGDTRRRGRFGRLEIDSAGRLASVDGERVYLSPKEYELLVYFADHEAMALSRERILNSVWDYDYFGDIRTVDTHVKRLRAKLGGAAEYIQTVRSVGYRFEASE